MQLNIVLTGLLSPEIELINSPNLTKLINHAKINVLDLSYSDIILGGQYKIGTSIATQIAKLHNIDSFSHYIICEPTHLRLDGNRLIIAESSLLQLDQNECNQIIQDLNKYFNEQVKFFYINDNCWLIGTNQLNKPASNLAILDIIGQDVNQYLSDNIKINQIINDAQMILANHNVNQVRNEEGAIDFNSIWLWDKILVSKLDFTPSQILFNINDCINNHYDDNALIIFDTLYSPSCYGDIHSWLDTMLQLDNQIWQQLCTNTNEIKINLYLPYNNITFKVQVTPLDKFKLWRNNNFNKMINTQNKLK